MKNEFTIMLIIVSLIIILVIILFSVNYIDGKYFKKCKNCLSNRVFFINLPLPNPELIEKLNISFKNNKIILNPARNKNNAQGLKINSYHLPEGIINFYMNDTLRESVSKILKQNVEFADISEKYRIFARLYENENDFLNWHYDNNFTLGLRYTLVIPILVSSKNTSEFMIKDVKTGEEKIIPIPLGQGVIYNGSITYHKITKQTKGEKRMVIIIPFYTNYKKDKVGEIREKIRNITYKTLKL